jgi:hypothetical protein
LEWDLSSGVDKKAVANILGDVKIDFFTGNFKPNAIFKQNSFFLPIKVTPWNLKIRPENLMGGAPIAPRPPRSCVQKRSTVKVRTHRRQECTKYRTPDLQTSKRTRSAGREIHRHNGSHF